MDKELNITTDLFHGPSPNGVNAIKLTTPRSQHHFFLQQPIEIEYYYELHWKSDTMQYEFANNSSINNLYIALWTFYLFFLVRAPVTS